MMTALTIATLFSAVSIVLLLALTAVWVRNYRQFGTPLVLGLVIFGVVLLLENAVAIYFSYGMSMFYASDPVVQQAVAILRGLQLVAIAVLTWATMQ